MSETRITLTVGGTFLQEWFVDVRPEFEPSVETAEDGSITFKVEEPAKKAAPRKATAKKSTAKSAAKK